MQRPQGSLALPVIDVAPLIGAGPDAACCAVAAASTASFSRSGALRWHVRMPTYYLCFL
jgi:hypothetical protein